jgi:hypothetical protein
MERLQPALVVNLHRLIGDAGGEQDPRELVRCTHSGPSGEVAGWEAAVEGASGDIEAAAGAACFFERINVNLDHGVK